MSQRNPNDYVSTYTPSVQLDPSTTCLVVVDIMYATGHPDYGLAKLLKEQGRFEEASYRFDRIKNLVVPNTLRLLSLAREHDMKRVFLTYGSEVEDYSDLSPQMKALCTATRNRRGLREHDPLDELEIQPTERIINKITPSAFTSSPIELILHTYGAKDLIFTGVSTNMCVEGTLRDASDKGFGCVLVDDASGADSQEYHDNACLTLQRLYGEIMQTDEVLARLDAKVGAPA
jgi:nicotinamidase-related amidase